MWIFPTKKQIKKELKKISNSFKKRDDYNSKQDKEILKNKENIESHSIKIARLEGVISVLLSKSQVSVSQSLKKSQHRIETKIINKVRRSKKALVMAEIEKLAPSCSVIEMFDIIVREKGLCSKASFYRYVSSLKSLKSQELIETETIKKR